LISALRGLIEALTVVLRILAPLLAEKSKEAHARQIRERESALLHGLDRGDLGAVAAAFDDHDLMLSEAGIAPSRAGEDGDPKEP